MTEEKPLVRLGKKYIYASHNEDMDRIIGVGIGFLVVIVIIGIGVIVHIVSGK